MATSSLNYFHFHLYLTLIISIYFTTITSTHAAFSEQSYITLPSDSEKVTHLRFYYHDIRNENNPTVVQIVDAPKNTPNGFGCVLVMDDALTEEPDWSSKQVGRAQGIFAQASLQDLGLAMLTNFVFTEGKYAGSTISMLGRNAISEKIREMPIVGGTGVFRFARGFAIGFSVHSVSTPQHYVVGYNVTISHP
ncbi:hypothetical protein PIB30_066575 [Stylosanthes scabra]|uniref:Dirigent protein n=1 Tax=Stylosanthes scabra TaxID=79078 RepID=A0ABU6TPR6_9FABA|nr:hypothetical protein [Stylosanthes scabra]